MYYPTRWQDARSALLLVQGMAVVGLIVAIGALVMMSASELADLLCVTLPRVRARVKRSLYSSAQRVKRSLYALTPGAYLAMVAFAAPVPTRVEVARRHLRTNSGSTTVACIAALTRAARRRQDRRMPTREVGAHRARGGSMLRAVDIPGVAIGLPHTSHRRVTA